MIKKIYLNVPYSEKEDAKELGARWDASVKKWYKIIDAENLDETVYEIMNELPDWFPCKDEFILYAPSYIVTSLRICWKCNKISRVYALGSHKIQVKHPNNVDIWEDALNHEVDARKYVPGGLFLINGMDFLDSPVKEYLREHAPKYYCDYSKTINKRYWMNHCEHCNIKFGDFDTFDEFGSAFGPVNEKQYKNLSLQLTPFEKIVIPNGGVHEKLLEYQKFMHGVE